MSLSLLLPRRCMYMCRRGRMGWEWRHCGRLMSGFQGKDWVCVKFAPCLASCGLVSLVVLYYASPIQPLNSSLPLLSHQYETLHTCFLHHILKHHMCFLCNWFPLNMISFTRLHSMTTAHDAHNRVGSNTLYHIPLFISMFTLLPCIIPTHLLSACPSVLFPSPHLPYFHAFIKLSKCSNFTVICISLTLVWYVSSQLLSVPRISWYSRTEWTAWS